MVCSGERRTFPSPSGEGGSPRSGETGGEVWIIPNGEATSPCPTLTASPSFPPLKGEGKRSRDSTLRAREFRKNLTPQEGRLWSQLRPLRAEGFHFRRQAPFLGYYLDFVCFSRRLVVEVDGGGHAEDPQAAHDAVRDAVLRREGFRTLRFWNSDINTNLIGVMEDILRALRSSP